MAELPLQLEEAFPTTMETCSFFSIETTGVYIPIDNSEILLAAVYNFKFPAWIDTDIT
jgi:hypothetical protein